MKEEKENADAMSGEEEERALMEGCLAEKDREGRLKVEWLGEDGALTKKWLEEEEGKGEYS